MLAALGKYRLQVKSAAVDIVALSGLATISYGAGQVFPALGYIVSGLSLLLVAYVAARA